MTNAPQFRSIYAANQLSSLYAGTGRIITAGLRLVF
jgi:hypothetical protein